MKKEAGRLTFLFFVAIAVLLFSGCAPDSPPGMKEQRVRVSPEFFKTWPSLLSVNRRQMGFPLLPTNGTVRILTVDRAHWKPEVPPPNYDIQFQFIEGSSDFPYSEQNVFVKQADGGPQWVGEQTTIYGPHRFTTDGIQVNESITITRERKRIVYLKDTAITYSGPDKRLAKTGTFTTDLTVFEIGPILREWGYKYVGDLGRPNPLSQSFSRPGPSQR
jgi:hypothetical protein